MTIVKIDENGGNFSKREGNPVVKEKLLIFPFFTVFKDLYCRHVKTWVCLREC